MTRLRRLPSPDEDALVPNPGGQVSPDDLVGREDELARLVEAVSVGVGAQVLGERRMGKTSLLAKLEDTLSSQGITVVRVSAETSDIDTFTARMLGELRGQRLIGDRISAWEKEFHVKAGMMISQVGLTLTGKVSREAEAVVELRFADLLASVATSGPVVVIIDEITVLCHALGQDKALEFLRSLRALRQGSRSVSVVLSGSIGLHHALADTSALNDLWSVHVGPLPAGDAKKLTQRLLRGIGAPNPAEELLHEIVTATSGIPFYIHGLADRLRSTDASGWDVDKIVRRCLADDTWETKHYVTRLSQYYGSSADIAGLILDGIATATTPWSIIDIESALMVSEVHINRAVLVQLLDQLVLDHYLLRSDNTVHMSSPLLARAWRVHRWLD